jgi:cytoskeletal protein RodZ
MSLEDVRGALGIPLHYLQAMEGGKSRFVADEFYLIPFLRRYADFLDLDPATTVGQFLAEAAREESRGGGLKKPDRSPAGNRWLLIGAAVLVIVAVGLWLALSSS